MFRCLGPCSPGWTAATRVPRLNHRTAAGLPLHVKRAKAKSSAPKRAAEDALESSYHHFASNVSRVNFFLYFRLNRRKIGGMVGRKN